MASEFEHGGTAEVGPDGLEEELEKFGVGMFAQWPAAAEKRADAKRRQGVAEDGVVLVTRPAKDGAAGESLAGVLPEMIKDGTDGFPDFGGFAGSGNDGNLRLEIGDWR